MKRKYVDSSMASSVGYDPLTTTLEIQFKSGEIWQYHNIPQSIHEAMLTSGSIGKFFQEHIKGKYRESRIA